MSDPPYDDDGDDDGGKSLIRFRIEQNLPEATMA